MRLKIIDKVKFTLGVFDIVVGIALVITCIYLHRTSKVAFAFFPILCGIYSLCNGIQTEREYEVRKQELESMFRKKDENDD